MNLKKITIALLLTAAFHGASFAQDAAAPTTPAAKQKPPAGGTPKPFTLPKKEVVTLKNGIQVTLIPYGAIPKVTVRADVRAGNLNEAENQIWLADLTGSLLKEGTATRSAAQIAEEAARMGGSVDVGVGADTTTVTGDVLSEFGPQLVALMGEVMTRPLLPAAELARLKNDQLRQLSIARSQPGPLANELFRKTLYPNHPYGRLYPTEEMVKSYTIEDVQKFYRENFSAARTRIYVAGQFDAAAMKKALGAAFEAWPRGAEAVINVPKPTAARALRLVDRPNAQQSTLYIGLPAIDPSNADYIPFLVTNSLLGGSFGSRITSNIREQKGYTYSPNSQVSVRYRDGFWVQVADVTTSVTGPSLKEIFYEIDRLQKDPPTEDELQGIKNYLAGIFVLQNSSRQGVIGQLAFTDLHGLPETYLSTYVQKVLAVTPQDVQRVTRQYLTPDKMAVVVVGDKAKIAEQLTPYGTVTEN